MNSKILMIALIAAVTIVIVAALAMININNNETEKDVGDLSLLDSTDKLAPGYTVTMKEESKYGYYTVKTVITNVSNNAVSYTYDLEERYQDDPTIKMLNDFEKRTFDFDYSDESKIPIGVTVSVIEDSYVINGEYTIEERKSAKTSAFIHKYDSLKITIYSTGTIKSVSGTMKTKEIYTDSEKIVEKNTEEYHFKTDKSTLYTDYICTEHYTLTDDKENYLKYATLVGNFDITQYGEAKITESTEKIGDWIVNVYNINGRCEWYDRVYVFEDFKTYVYKNHIIKEVGTLNGKKLKVTTHLEMNESISG